MSWRSRCVLAVIGFAFLLARPVLAAEDRPAPPEFPDDPLPAGALARLGTSRFRHEGMVFCLAFSPDGKTLAAAEGDSSPAFRGLGFGGGKGKCAIRFWDPATGKELRRLEGHQGVIRALVYSPDGKTLVSAGDDRVIRLWDVVAGKEVRQVPASPVVVHCVALSRDGKTLAAAGSANFVHLWDAATGEEVRRLQGLPMAVESVAFSPDGKTLAAGYNAEGVCVWDVASGREVHHLKEHQSAVWSVAFSPDGKILASGSHDQTIRLYDVADGKELRKIGPLAGSVQQVCFAPDGEALAAAGTGGASLWDPATGKEVRRLGDRPGRSFAVGFAPDGKTVAFSVNRAVRLADVATGKEIFAPAGLDGPVESVTFSPDGKTAATAGDGLRLWEADTGKVWPGEGPPARVSCAAFSPDGQTLILGCQDQTLRLWDAAADKEIRRFTGEPGEVEFVGFLPDGKTVASMSRQRLFKEPNRWLYKREVQVRFWDAPSGKEVRQVGNVMMERVALTPDGRFLATGMNDIQVWDATTGAVLQKLAHGGHVFALAFCPDGRNLVSSALDGTLRLWDTASGTEVLRFPGHAGVATACAVAPNGRLLASGGADRSVRVWDVESGKELKRFEGHRDVVLALAFSADGRRLISGSGDTTAVVWDVAGVAPPEAARGGRLQEEELKALWADLAAEDAARARKAVRRLAQAPAQAVPWVRDQLPLSAAVDPQRIPRLVAELDDDHFTVREKASAELAGLGKVAEPALREALAGQPSAEVRRRAQKVLDKLGTARPAPEFLQAFRAVEVLEQVGTPEARKVLEALARGTGEPRIGREARASLDRLTGAAREP